MKEAVVEGRLKVLERHGFAVYKLTTPGRTGVMDRMILWPKYAPRPPTFVEIKRPGEKPRPLQVAVACDWRARGCDVREFVDSPEAVAALVGRLLLEIERYRI